MALPPEPRPASGTPTGDAGGPIKVPTEMTSPTAEARRTVKRRRTSADPSRPAASGGPGSATEPHEVLDDELDYRDDEGDSGPDLTSPWPLGVFLGFATSLAANDPIRPNTTLTAVLFLVGFAAGVGLWAGIVALLGRGEAAADRAQALLTAEVDSEQVKLDAARLRLERARIERQIASLERDGRDMIDPPPTRMMP